MKEGSAHGSIGEQYTRKTILTVAETFPHMLKRQSVVSRREIIFTPIENSIETIEKRNADFVAELGQHPPQMKSLQSLLQGSVLLRMLMFLFIIKFNIIWYRGQCRCS